MPIFHANPSRVVNLVLQDAEKVWGRAVDGVLELSEAAAKRFRTVAAEYGYTEQEAAPKHAAKPAAKPAPAKDAE